MISLYSNIISLHSNIMSLPSFKYDEPMPESFFFTISRNGDRVKETWCELKRTGVNKGQ